MCDAMSVAIGMKGVSSVIGAGAAYGKGQAVKQADFLSADLEDRAASDALTRGSLKELQVIQQGSGVQATQRVMYSAGGADVNAGGQAATQRASEAVVEVSRAVVRRNAVLDAYGLRHRARAYRQAGETAGAEGEAAAIGTFLSGMGESSAMGMKMFSDMSKKSGDDGSNDYD